MISETDINKYLEKSGDDSVDTENLIENEKGFMSWGVNLDSLILSSVYGDGKYWDKFSIELAKQLGLKKIVIATRRSPKAYQRKYGYKLTGYLLEKEV